MLSATSQSGRRRTAALLAVAVACAGAVCGTGARADTQSDLRDAMAEVESLQADAAAAFERYQAAQDELAAVTSRLAALDAELATALEQVEQSRRAVGRVARASYMGSGMDASLYLLLAPDEESLRRGMDDLRRVGDASAGELARSRADADDLADVRAGIAGQQTLAAELRAEAERASSAAAAALAQAQQREADLQRRYAEELAALRAAQEAQARAEADRAREAAAQPADGTAPVGALPAVGSQRAQVVAWALDRVGSRYVLNGEGPQAFDCSGLVTAAYATIGVRVPSYTGAQADRVQPVPLAQAQPGDLLFYFGRGAQHVALYLGQGRMVHAVNPARGVTVNNLSDSWYADRFTMAGKLVD